MSLNFEGKAPDLVFYISSKMGESQQQEVGFLINKQTKRPIFSDKECKDLIGSLGASQIIEDNDKEITTLIFNGSYSLLELGSFIAQGSNYKQVKDSNGYAIPNNQVVVYTLTSGNGDFIGATGYVVVISDETPVRKNLVYFTHI